MGNKFEIITDKKTILKYFFLYALVNTLLLYYIHDILITDPQYFTGGNMRSAQLFRRVWTVIYFISPIYTFVKMFVVSLLIYQALKLIKKLDTQFWGVFYAVLLAQLVLVIPDLLELIWFTFIKVDYSMADIDYFSPLSIVNLVNYESLSRFTYKLLSSINIFNILYWILLIYLIKRYLKINFKESSVVVLSFYGLLAFIICFVYLFSIYRMSYGM